MHKAGEAKLGWRDAGTVVGAGVFRDFSATDTMAKQV